MKYLKLSPRLKAIADYAAGSNKVADVGTDHGYIPIWLLQSGLAEYVIASDIKAEPLERARQNAKKYGIENEIDFVLSAGISHIKSDSVDTVIIAGMGGETITEIIGNATWAAHGKIKFVLQPMTKSDELTSWLYESGFHIEDARLAEDDGEIYLVLLAIAGKTPKPGLAGTIVPEVLFKNEDPLLGRYIDLNIERISFAIDGLKSARALRSPERLKKLTEALNGLKEMKVEVKCRL